MEIESPLIVLKLQILTLKLPSHFSDCLSEVRSSQNEDVLSALLYHFIDNSIPLQFSRRPNPVSISLDPLLPEKQFSSPLPLNLSMPNPCFSFTKDRG